MREAVIVEAVRTPVGKRNGGLSGVHAADLSAVVLNALVDRTGLDPSTVDDVVWGCVCFAWVRGRWGVRGRFGRGGWSIAGCRLPGW